MPKPAAIPNTRASISTSRSNQPQNRSYRYPHAGPYLEGQLFRKFGTGQPDFLLKEIGQIRYDFRQRAR